MKKLLVLLAAVMVLIGCNNNKPKPEPGPDPVAKTEVLECIGDQSSGGIEMEGKIIMTVTDKKLETVEFVIYMTIPAGAGITTEAQFDLFKEEMRKSYSEQGLEVTVGGTKEIMEIQILMTKEDASSLEVLNMDAEMFDTEVITSVEKASMEKSGYKCTLK